MAASDDRRAFAPPRNELLACCPWMDDEQLRARVDAELARLAEAYNPNPPPDPDSSGTKDFGGGGPPPQSPSCVCSVGAGGPRPTGLAAVDAMTGPEFEGYVSDLLTAQGYSAERTGGSGDIGIDIVAVREGVKHAVQCKRSSYNLNRRAVSDVVGGMRVYGCSRAMLITNSHLRAGAVKAAMANDCTVVDRDLLSLWIDQFEKQALSPDRAVLSHQDITAEQVAEYLFAGTFWVTLRNGWHLTLGREHTAGSVVITGADWRDLHDLSPHGILERRGNWRRELVIPPGEQALAAITHLVSKYPIVSMRIRKAPT